MTSSRTARAWSWGKGNGPDGSAHGLFRTPRHELFVESDTGETGKLCLCKGTGNGGLTTRTESAPAAGNG
ncbi:hypothetical protein GCM10023257_65200 [Streptomyces hyderabadensis]|uniref:Uncharacterized protein n=1 Tax=Streptomyces hyderabadensis TaxID=598549 RepID=A0ABP9IT63_9ACTN